MDLVTAYMLFLLAIVWSLIWEGIGLWRSARSSHKVWFVAIFLLNTLGLLPIVYLVFFQKEPWIKGKAKPIVQPKKKAKKK